METTLSDQERSRLPTNDEKTVLSAGTVGAITAYMGAPILADVDRIVTAVDWGDGALTIAAQPDVPRNLTVTLTDANASITAGILTLVGEDAAGRVVTDIMDLTDGLTWVGTKIFAKVTSATISGTAGSVGAGVDQVTVGVGNVIGTPVDLNAAGNVVHAYVGAVRVTPDAIAVGASTSGIDANGATYDGSKVMWALLKPSKLA